jgi:hypothetical protein
MKKKLLVPAAVGWLAFFWLAYCGSPGLRVDVSFEPDNVPGAEAAPDDNAGAEVAEPIGQGKLYVVDDTGRLVGALVHRTHRLLDHSELFDAVMVYNPQYGLFFSVRMSSAEVLLPAKLFFTGGNCTGSAAVRANCPDCVSGYDLAFSYLGSWYRVPGGEERSQFKYTSYVADDDLEYQCTAHGNSSTYVYPLDTLGPGENPGAFVPPLRFVWGE